MADMSEEDAGAILETLDMAVAKADIAVGEIVQIWPGHHFPGCLVAVTDVKSWGVMGYIQLPGPCEGLTMVVPEMRAFVRLGWAEFDRTGGKIVGETRDRVA